MIAPNGEWSGCVEWADVRLLAFFVCGGFLLLLLERLIRRAA